MKNIYQRLSLVMIVIIMAIIPFASMAQEKAIETTPGQNLAPSYNYWSIGVFGGPMQYNGDLGRNHWVNVYSNSLGYNAGLVATKQFNRVIGVRARFSYGMVQGNVENKFCWEYKDGNGIREYITQSFKSTILETDLQLTLNWLNLVQDYKPERVVSSYIIAGIGLDQSKGTKWDINKNEIAYLGKKDNVMNVGNNKGMGGSDLRAKAVAGLGFDFNINKQISIPLEFAWRWQNSDDLDMELGGAMKVVGDMYSSATVGLTYKFGYKVDKPKVVEVVPVPVPIVVLAPEPVILFTVTAPGNTPVERKVREAFPIRNYVFFDLGSAQIPERYVMLRKDQVKDFREDQLESFAPKNLSGRSDRQMIVYYNVLNILGDRMVKNPSTTIKLVGSSEKGPKDGRAMAESIKVYLVSIFGIDASRISTEGLNKPRIPSEQPGGTNELELLRQGDRRVSIESSSPILLQEFQSGPATTPKVEQIAPQEAPPESYISFKIEAEEDAISSWSFNVSDEKGTVQSFGPYTEYNMKVPSKSILGERPEGDYKVTMTGQTKDGKTIQKEATAHMVLWTPPKTEETMRFSIIYEFNESKAIPIYEKYLTDVVTPKIPIGGTVIISGHTDIIGDEAYNLKLSLDRANNARSIIENSLSKAGRSDVKFEVFGYGEDQKLSPFDNKFPEERFYNRTVIIDINPRK